MTSLQCKLWEGKKFKFNTTRTASVLGSVCQVVHALVKRRVDEDLIELVSLHTTPGHELFSSVQ